MAGYKAIAYGGAGAIGYAASGTSVSVPYPSSIVAGQLLVLQVLQATATDDILTPSGWTKLASDSEGSGSTGANSAWFAKMAVGTESGNLTVSRSGDVSIYFYGIMWRTEIATYYYSDLTTLEKAGPVSGTSTSASSSSITPATDYSYVAVLLNLEDNTSIAQFTGGNYSERFDVSTNQGDDAAFAMDGYQQTTKATEGARTATIGGTDSWMTLTIAIKAAYNHDGAGTVAAQLTLTGNAKHNRKISAASAGSVTATGLNPDVIVAAPATVVSCTLGTATATGYDPVVTAVDEVIVDSITYTDYTFWGIRKSTTADYWHVSEWQAATETFRIHAVRAWMYQYGTVADGKKVWLEIWNDDSGNPGSLIAGGTSSLIEADSITTNATGESVSFEFPDHPVLTDGVKYYFVGKGDWDVSATNHIRWYGTGTGGPWSNWNRWYIYQDGTETEHLYGVMYTVITRLSGPVEVNASTGQVLVLGMNPEIPSALTVSCTLGTVTVAKFNPLLSEDLVVAATSQAVVVTGFDPLLSEEVHASCSSGVVTVTGFDATVTVGFTVSSSLGVVTATGFDALVQSALSVFASPGTITVTGYKTTTGQQLIVSANTGVVTVAPVAGADSYETVAEQTLYDAQFLAKIGSDTTSQYNHASEILSMPETCSVSRIKVWFARFGSPTGNIWLTICADDAGTPGSVISNGTSASVDVTTIETTGNGGEEVAFDFSTPPSLSASTNYYIIPGFDYSVDSSNHIRWWGHALDVSGWSKWDITQAGGETENAFNALYTVIQKTVAGASVTINLQTNVACTAGAVTVVGYNPDVQISVAGPTTVNCTLGTVAVTGYDVGVGGIAYYVCQGGTAANKAAADGSGGLSTYMSCSTHNGETFSPGDRIYISDYNGTILQQLTPPSSGTSGSKIRYLADGTPVIDGGDTRDYCVYLTGKSHLTFDGIEFKQATVHNIYILQNGSGNMDGLQFTNCRSHDSGGMGLMTNGAASNAITNLLVEDCRFDHNGNTGLGLGAYTQVFTLRRLECDHNAQNGAASDCSGIRPVCAPDNGWVIWGGLIEQCKTYSNGKDDGGSQTNAQAMGIWLDTLGDNSGANPCIIRHNLSYDNVTSGYHAENCDHTRWYGNVAYGNGDKGLWFSCTVTAYPSQYNVAYNNTCYGNAIGIQNSGNWGETSTETSISNIFRNNIASGNTSRELKVLAGSENAHGANGWGSGNVYTDNCFGAEANDFIEWALTAYDTYDAWEAVYEASSSIEADPAFKDAANDKFYLTGASPCIDAGVDLGATYDDALDPRILASAWPDAVVTLDQDSWGAAWEVGAYVYDGLAAAGTVAVTGLNPTVILTTGVIASCSLGTVTATALNVTLALPENVLTTLGAVTVAALSAEVETEVAVLATAGAVTVTGINPVVTVGAEVIVSCTLGTVAVTGFNATVTAAVTTTVTCTLGAVAVTRYDAVLGIETVILTHAFDTEKPPEVSVQNPKVLINTETAVAASVGAAIVTGYNPSVWVPTGVSASAGAVLVAGYDPDVSIIQPGIPATLGTVTVSPVTPVFAMRDWKRTKVDADHVNVTVLGKAASIIAPIIAATLGAVAVTGYAAEIHEAHIQIAATTGVVTVAGYPASSHMFGVDVQATKGAVVVTGLDAEGLVSAQVKATKGAVTVSGAKTIVNALAVWATPGQVVVLGANPAVVAPLEYGESIVAPSQTSKNYISYYQDWAHYLPAPIARRWREFLRDTFYIATPLTTAGGTANSIELTTDAEIAQYTEGDAYRFIAAYTNTGGTILDVNDIGPQTVNYNDSPLQGGEIVAGGAYEVMFDGNAWNLTSSSRSTAGSAGRTWMDSGNSLSYDTWEKLTWTDGVIYDDAAFFSPVGSTIDSVVIPENGRYRITAHIEIATPLGRDITKFEAALYANDVEIDASMVWVRTETINAIAHIDYVDHFSAGDRIEVWAYYVNSFGSGSATLVGALSRDEYREASWFAIERLR